VVLKVLSHAAKLGHLVLNAEAVSKLGGGLQLSPEGCSAALAASMTAACMVAAASAGSCFGVGLMEEGSSHSMLQGLLDGVAARLVRAVYRRSRC
jgi:hypothetical protein